MDGYVDFVAMAGQCFVDGVVEHFKHHVVQAAAVLRVADVHAGAFAYRFQAFEHLNAVGTVFFVFLLCHIRFYRCFAVKRPSEKPCGKRAAQAARKGRIIPDFAGLFRAARQDKGRLKTVLHSFSDGLFA